MPGRSRVKRPKSRRSRSHSASSLTRWEVEARTRVLPGGAAVSVSFKLRMMSITFLRHLLIRTSRPPCQIIVAAHLNLAGVIPNASLLFRRVATTTRADSNHIRTRRRARDATVFGSTVYGWLMLLLFALSLLGLPVVA